MEEGEERENRGHKMDYHRVPQWNVISQYPMRDQNAFHVNTKISMLYEENDVAIKERDRALAEKKAAILERDVAIEQRDAAIAERDNAIRERDNAIAALRFHESTVNALLGGVACGLKRINHPSDQHPNNAKSAHNLGDCTINAFPVTVVPSDAKTKAKKNRTAKLKKVRGDLNRHVSKAGSKAEWDAQEFGSADLIHYDESTMPAPVCSCTGVARQCYKWGSGGWQSACCTTSLSLYPLPQLPNKKHSRIGGRKMSGGVFNRLLSRLAAAGHDLSVPVDLKNYWAKHGTNRYITIK